MHDPLTACEVEDTCAMDIRCDGYVNCVRVDEHDAEIQEWLESRERRGIGDDDA